MGVGVAGIGKTVLASAIVRDNKVRRIFSDGIYWFAMDQTPDILAQQNQLARDLNLSNLNIRSIDDGRSMLSHTVQARRILLILDDVVRREQIEAFDIVGDNGRLLIITRDSNVLADIGIEPFRMEGPSEEEALQMLALSSGTSGPVELRPEAVEVARAGDFLPSYLAMIGTLFKNKPDAWNLVLNNLRSNAISELLSKFPEFPNRGMLFAIFSTLQSIDEGLRSRFMSLAVFVKEKLLEIPLAAIAGLWEMEESQAESFLDDLVATGLLQFDSDKRIVRLHELIGAYLSTNVPESQIQVSDLLEPPKDKIVGFAGDTAMGKDQLGITSEVNAFSAVLAAKDVEPPLCLGIFGDWGTGKSFFLAKMQERIELLGKESKKAEKDNRPSAFSSHIVQITFNAWHYVDANLWASLACRIFEGLDESFTLVTQEAQMNPEESKAKLFKELQTAKEQREQAERQKKLAEDELQAAEKSLAKLQKEREKKSIDLKELVKAVTRKALDDNPQIKLELENASSQLGLTSFTDNITELKKRIDEMKWLHGRFKAIWLALLNAPDRRKRISCLIAIIVSIPLIGEIASQLINHFLHSDNAAKLAAMIGQATGLIVLLTAWLQRALKWSSGALTRLEKAQKQTNDILQEARRKPGPEEEKLSQELAVLHEREATAKRSLEAFQERVKTTEKKLKEIEYCTSGRCLADFIHERVRSSAYQSHLGIISTIRRDFHSLSELLTRASNIKGDSASDSRTNVQETNDLPRIDRIVLYIDDLDRCPEDKVVEVLQAVHLLLYFKLFVVVIAVDSRWLLRSLQKQYFALQGGNHNTDMSLLDSKALMSTTPQNYLEKIIQIPFNLRTMGARELQRLVTSLSPHIEDEEDTAHEQQRDTTKHEESPSISSQEQSPVASSTSQPPSGAANHPAPSMDQALPPPHDDIDLLPEALKITKRELTFIEKLSPMIPTPRAAKRLLNIYRLIRASVKSHELPGFLGKDGALAEYEAVLVLLALQIGFPLAVSGLFNRIVECDDSETWGWFVKKLPSRPQETMKSPLNSAQSDDIPDGSQLYACLTETQYQLGADRTIASFKKWIPKVSRYSFRNTK